MIINSTNYLDFGSILTYEVIGSYVITIFIGWIIIFWLSQKFKIPYMGSIALGIIWTGAMISLVYNPLIWFLLLMGVAVIGYATYAKVIKR